jgi:Zn-dependent peptidase ImmA (M78 family)
VKKNNKGALRARKLLFDIGLDDVNDFPFDILVAGLGATLICEPLSNSDGTIIRGNKKTLIKVNSDIPYEEKKRFTIAHEIGHLLLHDRLDVHNDNANTLNWFKSAIDQAKKGMQEWEANDFASELLMPRDAFILEASKFYFDPALIKHLSIFFKTSITSTIFRCLYLNIYPVFIVFTVNGVVQYWLKSRDLKGYVKDINRLAPPADSVAFEYIKGSYNYIYSGVDKKQEIRRSTWFELYKDQKDEIFYEYCIPTKQYKSIISLVWQS